MDSPTMNMHTCLQLVHVEGCPRKKNLHQEKSLLPRKLHWQGSRMRSVSRRQVQMTLAVDRGWSKFDTFFFTLHILSRDELTGKE